MSIDEGNPEIDRLVVDWTYAMDEALLALGFESLADMGEVGMNISDLLHDKFDPDGEEDYQLAAEGMRDYYEEMKGETGPIRYRGDPSEMSVAELVIRASEELTGDSYYLEPAYVILEAYESFLKKKKAKRKELQRLRRIMHNVSDEEMHRTGRG